MTSRPSKPTIAQIREISQPASVTGRSNAEHWIADLYLRKISVSHETAFEDTNYCKWCHLLDDYYGYLY